MAEFAIAPSDEPFDFRHQAATYARYRRDYSSALYDAIEARAGAGAGRLAVDVGCGPGFVAASLARRGWHPIGVDFSAPMLAAARDATPGLALVRSRGECMPLRPEIAALVTCGTAFHWLAPVPALEEFARVTVRGGWTALCWRYAAPGQPHMRAIRDALADVDVALPDVYEEIRVHPTGPFDGSAFVAAEEVRCTTELDFTADSFLGYVATIEFLRRFAGARHAEFLARLGERITREFPTIRETNVEYLFLARRS